MIWLLAEPENNPRWVAVDDISAPRASTWGPVLVARHLFEKLSLGAILDAGQAPRRHGQPLSERIFPLRANRLSRPGSDRALAQWLEDFYVCTAQGSRWMPVWKQSGRVKVGFDQLKLWYQSLDDLLAEKERISRACSNSVPDITTPMNGCRRMSSSQLWRCYWIAPWRKICAPPAANYPPLLPGRPWKQSAPSKSITASNAANLVSPAETNTPPKCSACSALLNSIHPFPRRTKNAWCSDQLQKSLQSSQPLKRIHGKHALAIHATTGAVPEQYVVHA